MRKELKHYRVIADDSDVYAISLVEEPAVEVDFVALAKDKERDLRFSKDEKKEKYMVLGAVLIPDQQIYRNDDGHEFYLSFDADCVERLAHKFMTNLSSSRCFTKDHESFADGCSLVESWIKVSERDKSVDYGFDCPIGTWFIACKVDSMEVWQSIKDGKRNGFSVESLVDLEEMETWVEEAEHNNNKKVNDMSKKVTNLETMEVNDGFWDKLKGIIADALGTSKDDPKVEDAVDEAKDEAEPVEENVEAEEESPITDEVVDEVIDAVEGNAPTEEQAADDLQEVVDQ